MFGRRYTYTIFAPALFLFSIILYLYTEMKNTLSRTYLYPAPFLPFPYVPFIIYSIYRYREYFSATFYHFSRPFLTFYYTPIIYR